jgi:hypothetical protein
MPVKRRISKARNPLITPEAVALFRRGLEIIKAGDEEFWEEDGGHRSEYLDITKRLDWVLLHIHPGDAGPLDIVLDGDEVGGSEMYRASIPRARELRRLLMKGRTSSK